MRTGRFHALAAVLTGGLLATTQAPLGFWWALLPGIAMAYLLWRRAETGRRAFRTGWIVGTVYFAGTLFWIVEPFLVEPEKFAWMIPIALPAMAGGLALFWGAGFALAWRVGGRGAGAPLALALGWMGMEALRGVVLTGFPWAQPGYALVDVPPIQMAAYAGINGVTLLALLAGCLLGAAVAASEMRARVAFGSVAALIVAGSWGAGAARLGQAVPERAQAVTVGLAQPNVPQAEKWRPDLRDAQLADLLERTRILSEGGADVVIWPEAATPFPIAEMADLRAAIARNLRPEGVLLAGGIRVSGRGTGDAQVHNSLLAVGGDAALLKTYDKQHLVPFGEYVPFDGLLTAIGVRAVISLPGGFSPGEAQDRVLRAGTLPPFGALVCYEAIFPHEVLDRGAEAEWLVHVTNDAWFGRIAGPQQHLAQTRVRAIERGMPVARAANTGVSAMIDPFGRVIGSLPLNEAGNLLLQLPDNLQMTMYHRWEEWPFIVLFIIAVIAVATLNGRYGEKRVDAP